MNNGKYSKNNRKRRLRWSKQFVLLASIAVMLVGIIGGTLAYLTTSSGSVVNTFTPGKVDITVNENFDGSVKENVAIENTGNVDAKIRAMIVVTWQDEKGNVYPAAPVEGVDYNIFWTKDGWSGPTNGWYVYNDIVPSEDDPETEDVKEDCTGYLFTSCSLVEGKTPEGYHLVVDVIAEAIQAEGGAQW